MSSITSIEVMHGLLSPVGNCPFIHKSKWIWRMCELCITQIGLMDELYECLIGFTHALLKRFYILKAFKKNSQNAITKP